VAAVIFNDIGNVLLVERGRPPSQGLWGLPGGLLDLGETLAEGVRREVKEECGVEIAVGELIDVFEPIQRDVEDRVQYHYVVIDFLAHYISGEPRAEDDAAAIAWVAQGQLGDLAMSEKTRQVIHRGYQLWQQDSALEKVRRDRSEIK
jgi:mutator protein MutT